MNIRQAILKAADHIEFNPGDFDFGEGLVPHGCGSPGCALGWIGHFLGGCTDFVDVSMRMGFSETKEFYLRLTRTENPSQTRWEYGKWAVEAPACARALRAYADKYHPLRTGLPDVVRAIFTRTQTDPPPATAEEWLALHDRVIEQIKNA